jgi:membrane fusion protein, copper/silver efflux system
MTRNAARIGAYGMILVATIAGVWMMTRGGPAPAAAPAVHDHAAMAAGEVAKSVTISSADAQRIGVTFAQATSGSFAREVRTVGQVVVDETKLSTVTARVDGWVEQLFVNQTGQLVREGEPLLAVYSPMLVAAQEELLLARRLQRDVGDGDAAAKGRADDLVASSRRRLLYWGMPERDVAELERADQVHRTITLRSASRGYVVEKAVFSGQRIMAGELLFKLADLATVWVEGEVFEQDLAGVRLGQRVTAEFDALPGTRRTGRISYVYPTLNPETRTVRVRVALPNGDMMLKPGMYATMRIEGTSRAFVVTVPRSAVLSTGERSIVFVREAGGHLTAREVSAGAANDDRIEILRGLAAGESVVASATFLVDAESNLGTALGGMGNMPGMEVTAPPKPLPPAKKER